jgi:hypothetical protein
MAPVSDAWLGSACAGQQDMASSANLLQMFCGFL